ncbi:signal peptidase I [Paenibacillus frigoriresistens]|uniref:signal peptidase I n=1 Tax=Paenibacillus alginolyticus TaxID=59839 RepID=UPI001564A8CE|nr:signal peptidase I [Paenibacillus frigoriresistens]NRF90548.1 signal peptidase I [Paenibacillus frigoriresistens]
MQFHKEFVQIITHAINKRGWIELPARGTSMYPFIKKGDICRFVSTLPANLKKGDVILFHTPHGNLVAHRFCRLVTRNEQLHYLCKGDANLAYDEAIAQEQLIGKMTWIRRNGRIIHVSSLPSYVWGQIVLAFPMISQLLRGYLNRRESTQA